MFNLKAIEDEYNFAVKQFDDIPNLRHPTINISDVIKAYFYLADYFLDDSTGKAEKMTVGIKSYPLIGSAVGRQFVSYGGKDKYSHPIDICATLFYGLVTDHAFVDGNKRTALLILIYQLQLYGYFPKKSIDEFERLVIIVAERSFKKNLASVYNLYSDLSIVDAEVATISHRLKRMTEKVDRSYHLNISAKDFCDALRQINVNCTLDNNKIKFERSYSSHQKIYKYSYTMVFAGWTRPVRAGTARKVFDKLHLTEEYPTYQSVFDKLRDPFYKLINRFEAPLRRLKDE